MTVCWLSFRIADDRRREDLISKAMDAANPNQVPEGWWDRTETFIVFDTIYRLREVAEALRGTIDVSEDLFLLRAMTARTAFICGYNNDTDIYGLMSTNGTTYLEDITYLSEEHNNG